MKTSYLFLFLLLNVLTYSNVYPGNKNDFLSKDKAGMGLLPVPQSVSLTDHEYVLNNNWFIGAGSNILQADPALQSLTSALKARFGFTIKINSAANIGNKLRGIHLIVKAGSVTIGKATDTNRNALMQQAYHLKLDKEKITITANAAQGLFYGVQTFIQLLQKDNGKIFFAGGAITDWPDMDLRMIYWDDAHHLDRLDAMKRAIKQASYFKINAFALKLEGHFEFKSAKPIVEPYAYTTEEYQELTDYARAHYIELVPFLDAPAHIAFILKHPEYKSLRAFPNSNYELSVIDPKADQLMLGMMNDLIDASKGGKYFLFSTDEAYYVGMSESEKKRADLLGGNGRLLAEYITRIANKLHEKGRKVIIWGEYPLRPSDINSLPSHIINGVYDEETAHKFKEHGMRQLIYTSVQGVEPLFPNYYNVNIDMYNKNSFLLTDDENQQGNIKDGRVAGVLKGITSAVSGKKSDFMGVIVAAWGDAGLNPETFWLGYSAGAASGWNHTVTSEELMKRFYRSFYGNDAVHIDSIYKLLSHQAIFYEKSWDWKTSKNRTPILGNSDGFYDTPRDAKDQTLPQLPIPLGQNLSLNMDWNDSNKVRLEWAEKFLMENNTLIALINENMVKANYQLYNLQVLLSVAQLCRQNLKMLIGLQKINNFLQIFSEVASNNPAAAISLIDMALDKANDIREERNNTLQLVTSVWYQDWYPRVAEANGRKYLDQVDDIKDHRPVRTVDMSYLIYRELKFPLQRWACDVLVARNQFARLNNLPMVSGTLNWEDIRN